ncbi:MAG: hypothetical protein ACTH5T_06675, partial [Leuconostoc mesenteroides]
SRSSFMVVLDNYHQRRCGFFIQVFGLILQSTNIITSAEKYELPIEVYDASEARKKWPQFTMPDQFRAVLEKNSGYLKSELAIDTYVKEAKRLGAHEQFNT